MDSDWESLPFHLLQSIFEKAETMRDFLHFEVVCSSWRYVANGIQHIIGALPCPVPMLLIPNEENDSHRMCNVFNGSFLDSKIIVTVDKRFGSSSQGWLLVVENDYSVTLYKAAEGGKSNVDSIIRLPPLFPYDDDDEGEDVAKDSVHYHITKVIFTAEPLSNSDRSCTIVVIFNDMCEVAFIRPKKDSMWTRSGDILNRIWEALYFNNQFYALNFDGELVSFMITEQGIISDIKLVADVPRDVMVGIRGYLVESNGKILQVVRYMDWRFLSDDDPTVSFEDDRKVNRETNEVEVYELDIDGHKWIQIEDIGDRALFMGDNSSVSVSASKFSGCRSNSIYFTHDCDSLRSCKDVLCDYGIYDLERRRMQLHFGLEKATIAKNSGRVPIWVVP